MTICSLQLRVSDLLNTYGRKTAVCPDSSKLDIKPLTTGDGESAMLPMDAFSSSTVAVFLRMSLDCSGLILILNFLWDSSSSSDSLEE